MRVSLAHLIYSGESSRYGRPSLSTLIIIVSGWSLFKKLALFGYATTDGDR